MGKGRERMQRKQAEKATEQPQQQQQAKIGAGALGAAYRQGLAEIGQLVVAFHDGVKPVETANTIWGQNPTPRDSYESKHGVTEQQVKAAEQPKPATRQKDRQIEPGE